MLATQTLTNWLLPQPYPQQLPFPSCIIPFAIDKVVCFNAKWNKTIKGSIYSNALLLHKVKRSVCKAQVNAHFVSYMEQGSCFLPSRCSHSLLTPWKQSLPFTCTRNHRPSSVGRDPQGSSSPAAPYTPVPSCKLSCEIFQSILGTSPQCWARRLLPLAASSGGWEIALCFLEAAGISSYLAGPRVLVPTRPL